MPLPDPLFCWDCTVQEVMAELTDTSQLGKRGELWFVAQSLAIIAVIFPPGGLEVGGSLGCISGWPSSAVWLTATTLRGL
jgi:hypothetical protein